MSTNKNLTNDTIRTLPAGPSGDAVYPDSNPRNGVPGLYLRVRGSGARSFVIQWRARQRQHRHTLGKVGVLSLDEARKKARKMLVGIDEGNDPIAMKAKARINDSQVFETVAREYLDFRAKDMRPGSLEQCRLHLLKYFKPLHRLPLRKVERGMIAAELRTISKERGAVAADRGRSTLSALFGWCLGQDLVEVNPVIGTNKQSKAKSRDRVLTDAELVKIWHAVPHSDFGRIVKLLMLTGQRRDEIADLKWTEISEEGDIIALPAARTKNGRPHNVPLPSLARSVLDEVTENVRREQVFGRGETGFSGFHKTKLALDAKAGLSEPWVLHDLRRTAATRMCDLGTAPHVVEAILNHVSGHRAGVAGIYNKSVYGPEKRSALDAWGRHIEMLLAQADGANVTKLRA